MSLHQANQHFKFEIKAHVQKESSVIEHSSMYALSEKADKFFQNDCKHEHTDIFESCLLVSLCNKNVHDAYKIVLNEITKDIADVMDNDFLYAGKTIQDWHTHCLRAVHQDYAKQHVFIKPEVQRGLDASRSGHEVHSLSAPRKAD